MKKMHSGILQHLSFIINIMPTLNCIGKDKVVTHHNDVPYHSRRIL